MSQIFEMKLRTDPFNRILNGTKTIEYRLYDQKRALLNKGDCIRFTEIANEGAERTLLVEIVDIITAENFVSLKQKLVEMELLNNEIFFPDRMRAYYSESDETTYGVMGIKIKVIGTDS